MSPAQDAQSTIRRLSSMLKVYISQLPFCEVPLTLYQLVFAQSLLYQLAINLVKMAFTFQYLRVFSHIRCPKYYCYVLIVSILGATAWGVFGIIFLCKPISTYWDVKMDGKCMNAEHHFWSTSIVGIVIDWAIWVLPMPIVRQLNLPRRQKWGLWVVFGLGGFVCVVSILRLTLVHKAMHEGKMTGKLVHRVYPSVLKRGRVWHIRSGVVHHRAQRGYHLRLATRNEAAVRQMDPGYCVRTACVGQRRYKDPTTSDRLGVAARCIR